MFSDVKSVQAISFPFAGGSSFAPKQPIFRQGEPADSIFFVEAGLVKFTMISKAGKPAVIALFGPGDFFGEGCLTGQVTRKASASPLTDARIVRIGIDSALQALRENRVFSQRFLDHLLFRHVRTEQDLVDQLIHSTEKRLARILLLLSDYGMTPDIGKISHETLAEMIGSTRSRVTYFMNRFRRLGLTEPNGIVRKRQSLEALLVAE